MGALSPRAAFPGSLRGKKRYRCSRRHGLSLRYAGGKRLAIGYALDPQKSLTLQHGKWAHTVCNCDRPSALQASICGCREAL